jgi:hypothetical protein
VVHPGENITGSLIIMTDEQYVAFASSFDAVIKSLDVTLVGHLHLPPA